MDPALRARHERIRPLEEMEAVVVRGLVEQPAWLPPDDAATLRYALNLARVEVLPTPRGDVDLGGALEPFRARLVATLDPLLRTVVVGPARNETRALAPALGAATREARAALLARFADAFSADELDREVCHKALAVVAGGGGGAGYVYGGAFRLIDELGRTPDLLVGTSMGSIMSLFRAHRRRFDLESMIAVARRMQWSTVFSLPHVRNKYGLPATLRLYLRRALGDHFTHPESGRVLRMDELEIPLRVVVAGVGRGGLAHDIEYYEHLADEVAEQRPGALPAQVVRRQVGNVVNALRELARRRAALREIVIGGEPLTASFDVLDAVGFSSAVPALIHYDVWRKDPHMHAMLASVLEAYGVLRLIDGGVINNVPARVAWSHVQRGDLRTRNAFVLALDAFAPQLRRNLLAHPVQRLVRPQVERNTCFANHLVTFRKVPSPTDLVPAVGKIEQAMRNGYAEMAGDRAFLREMLRPLRLPGEWLSA